MLSEVDIQAKTDNSMAKNKEHSLANIDHQEELCVRWKFGMFLESFLPLGPQFYPVMLSECHCPSKRKEHLYIPC